MTKIYGQSRNGRQTTARQVSDHSANGWVPVSPPRTPRATAAMRRSRLWLRWRRAPRRGDEALRGPGLRCEGNAHPAQRSRKGRDRPQTAGGHSWEKCPWTSLSASHHPHARLSIAGPQSHRVGDQQIAALGLDGDNLEWHSALIGAEERSRGPAPLLRHLSDRTGMRTAPPRSGLVHRRSHASLPKRRAHRSLMRAGSVVSARLRRLVRARLASPATPATER